MVASQKLSEKLNFLDKLDELNNTLSSWRRRNLTLYGRINIVKTLGISKIVFNSSVLCVPKNFASQVDKITYDFIWSKKPAKIKKKTLIGPLSQGGLNMISFSHLEKAIKLAWIKRLLNENQAVGPSFQILL